jgi:carbamate kinase
VFGEVEARRLADARGWQIARDGEHYRRVVPSPAPIRILELDVIELLVDHGVIVICAGGGGIPIVRRADGGLVGVEAVIDKDLASALLARELGADALLMLTDVDAVWTGWGQPDARALRRIAPAMIRRYPFAAGSMGPKVEATCAFVEQTGGIAGIGGLSDAQAILAGRAGTLIAPDATKISWWD